MLESETIVKKGPPFGNANGVAWTDEHSAALRLHVEAGCSFALCATKINLEFGTTYSRNAAIGRSNRMGMQQPMGQKLKACTARIAKKHKPRMTIVAANGNSNHQKIRYTIEAAEIAALRCIEIVPRGILLDDLSPGDCRYPYGDGPFTFCGHPKREGSSYCAGHFGLTRIIPRVMTDAERQRRRQAHAIKMKNRILEIVA